MNEPAKKAIGMLGGRSRVSDLFSVSYEAVRKWEETGIPMKRCAQVVKALSGKMSVQDFYPEFAQAAQKEAA